MNRFINEPNRIFVADENGNVLAEILFPLTSNGECTITHTFVDDSLRGQGIAGELVKRAVSEIEKRGLKIKSTCSYASNWLQKNGKNN